MSTAQRVLDALQAYDIKPTRNRNEWTLNSPLRAGSNSHAFSLKIDDDEHGAFIDFVSGEKGSLYDLARALGVTLPEMQNQAVDTHRGYKDADDYARDHGVSADVLAKAGIVECTYRNRPALKIPTQTGDRHRYLDGNPQLQRYDSPKGYQRCWYGLERAMYIAHQTNTALLICNGEISTVVAQHYGLPACCVTAGEKELPLHCLQQLREQWTGDVWIVLDCDKTGREYAPRIAAQIGAKATVLDIGLTDGGDIADYCRLNGEDALIELAKLAAPKLDGTTTRQTAATFGQRLRTETPAAPALLIPFRSFHALGGMAKYLRPRKLAAVVAPSAHGKTSWLETWADHWLIEGQGGLWYGSEWDSDEYHTRRIRRYSDVTDDMIVEHQNYMASAARGGVPDGKLLTDAQLQQVDNVGHMVAQWRGQLEYFPATTYLEDTLESMSKSIRYRRKYGELVTFVIFDYVQLLRVKSTGSDKTNNLFEHATGTIKAWCEQHDIAGLVGAQVTKEKTKEVKQGRLLDASDANFIREDKFNLFVTLNIRYEPDLSAPLDRDGNRPFYPTNKAVANIVKNNNGKKGEINLFTNFARYLWIDQQWTK